MSVAEYRAFGEKCWGRVNDITSRIARIETRFQNFPNIPQAQLIADCEHAINNVLLELQEMMDKYIHEFFRNAPVEVTRKSLVFSLRNLIIESVNVRKYRYTTHNQLALCTFTEDIFLSLFAEDLRIPRLPANPPPPGTRPREARGPQIFRDSKVTVVNPGTSKGSDDDMHNPGINDDEPVLPDADNHASRPGGNHGGVSSSQQYHITILENLHRRLTALEARMGSF